MDSELSGAGTSRASSSVVTIIAARRVFMTPLRAILRDWGSLGLTHPVLLVDLDQRREGSTDLPALEISEHAARMVRVQDRLADTVVDRVRYCAVSFAAPGGVVSGTAAQEVAGVITQGLPYVKFARSAMTVGAPDADFQSAIPELMGWQSMVLSPEDALSPLQGSSDLRPSFDAPQWHLHAAGAICSVLGLWRGQADSVIDNASPASDGSAVPVRVFSRSVAAEGVESELRQRLISLGDRYPTPRVDTSLAVATDNESGAAQHMSSALLTKHHDVLPRPRTTPPPPPAKEIGFMEALRQFFAFMLASLKNAPRAFAESLVRGAARATAGAVDHLVFGAGSGYVVVARGIRADGSPASWAEIEEGLDQTRRHQGNDVGAPVQYPQMWRDFVGGGLTLLDGGRRVPEMPPLTQGVTVAVVTNTAMVAPAPEAGYELPGHLGAYLPNWRIEVADDIGTHRLVNGLDRLAQTNPQLAQDISAEKHRLHSWYTATSQSYVGRVGSTLGQAYRSTTAEIESLVKKVEDLRAIPDLTDDIAEDQRRLARRFKILGIGSVLLVIALICCIVFGVLGLLLGIGLILLSLVGTLVTGCVMYMKGQRRLYQFIHRKEQAATALETATRHLSEALEDLRKLTRAYRQYLDWARALGAFIHAPLGAVPPVDVADLSIGQGMPRSIRLGAAQVDNDAVDEVAGILRRDLFRAGWLSAPWEAYVGDLPTSLGDLRYTIASDATMLDRDPNPDGKGPVLTRWSQAVSAGAGDRPAPVNFLAESARLLSQNASARDRLLARVAYRDSSTGALEIVTRADFEQGLDLHSGGDQGRFRGAVISPYATNINASMVHDSVAQNQYAGLAHATVLVQYGPSLSRSEFSAAQAPSQPAADQRDTGASSTAQTDEWSSFDFGTGDTAT